MNKEVHSGSLQQDEYSHAKNTNIFNEYGNGVALQSEHSNILSSKFKEGFKVIGFKNHPNRDVTYFFLTNPSTNVSEIGYISNLQQIENEADIETHCSECDIINKLNTPLEDTVQVETSTYVTLVEDSCNGCLNFSIDYPIFYIEIKEEQTGTKIYWTDNLNPQRHLDVDNLEQYSYTGEEVCGINETEPTCLDCSKLRMFPLHQHLQLEVDSLQIGGRLRRGVYEFVGAYCDVNGVEISEYHSITQPISVFDTENNVLSQTEISERTNFAIKINVPFADKKFQYYKIVVIQTTFDGTSYFVEGIHPITDTSFVYASEDNKTRYDNTQLFRIKPIYKKAEILLESGNTLFQGNVEQEEEWNLQPVINLLGSFAKWVTVEASEKIYQNGALISKFRTRMRDEVYPHGIKFYTNTGYYTPVFPLISRPPKETDLEIVSNKDTDSVLENAINCTTTDRFHRWQFYNTATNDGILDSYVPSDVTTVRPMEKVCVLEGVHSTDSGSISLPIEDFEGYVFTTLADFIRDNYDYIIEYTGDNAGILTLKALLIATYPDCDPTDLFPDFCEEPELIDTQVVVSYVETGQKERIKIEGTSGTADIDIEGVNYEMVFDTDITTTINNFITTHADDLSELNVTISLESPDILVVENGNASPQSTTITNTAGDLTGATIDTVPLEGEEIEYTEIDFAEDYSRIPYPEYCNPFVYDNNGDVVEDPASGLGLNLGIALRQPTVYLEKCNMAEDIVHVQPNSQPIGIPYHHFVYSTAMDDINSLADLLQSKNGLATGSGTFSVTFGSFTYEFYTELHKGALWYKSVVNNNRFILEVTPVSECGTVLGDFPDFGYYSKYYRISIWNRCSDTTPLYSTIAENANGFIALIDVDAGTLTEEDGTVVTLANAITSGIYYVTIDVPIVDVGVEEYLTHAACGCFSIFTRNIEYATVTITYDSIILDKFQRFIASCTYPVPQPDDCNPQGYETGDFAYWESLDIYPDNDELYNSKLLKIHETDILPSIKSDFEDLFVSKAIEGEYVLSNQANFVCKPIRHFKYPDNSVTSFTSLLDMPPLSDAVIYPIGFTIDENIVNCFLDIAVSNNLITQSQRDSIVGYEIFTGDRTGNKSIISKGLAFDSFNYKENNKTVEYANFPYNDLGENRLFLDDTGNPLKHPFNGIANNKFMYMSPDLYINNNINATEVSIEGFLFGNNRSVFTEVKDHPEWVILGNKAKSTAQKIANIEALSEIFLMAMTGMEVFRISVGTSSGFNIAGIVLYVANLAFATANAYVRVGQYRLQWLRTIRDLGKPYNFAYRMASVGIYNYFSPNDTNGDRLRGVSAMYKLRSGLNTVTDKQGNISYINNIDRESSLYISFGEGNEFDYPVIYYSHDNSSQNYSLASRFLSRDMNCPSGLSPEYIKNIASPYFSLKNYNPNQYGTIESVKWLSTSYFGNLSNPNITPKVFGGDVFISRFAEERSVPMFLANAIGQADLTPFEYKRYSNIGLNPAFYCDYETGGEDYLGGGSVLFPDIASDFVFDCMRGLNSYFVKPPNKFYLFYQGIPSYLVESEINTNFRYAKEGLENSFYPQTQDYIRLTEPARKPIGDANKFFYNPVYSKSVSQTQYKFLPTTYTKELYEKMSRGDNNFIYSEVDNSEFSLTDPWLIYKPNNYTHFPTKHGRLIGAKDLESSQLMLRFENMFGILNALDNIDRITPETQVQGTAGMFQQRMIEFNRTDLGFAGTQNKTIVSCEFGHFWADAERGQVFVVQSGARDLQEISRIYNGKPTGMRSWFKNHLPFKIKKGGVMNSENINIDNPFKGIGITMGWDSRYERVFLTKRDYEVIGKDLCYYDNKFHNVNQEIVDDIIEEHELLGWEYVGLENCKVKFRRELPSIPVDTDIYAMFDTTSMIDTDGVDASNALKSWFSGFQAEYPSFNGNLYILCLDTGEYAEESECWVNHPTLIQGGQVHIRTSGLWGGINQLPPNLNDPLWVPPSNIVVLSFVDETNDWYHSDQLSHGFGTVVQPTLTYTSNFNNFLVDYSTNYSFFKGVIYPIPRDTTGFTASLVLQACAAIEGTILTQSEIDAYNSPIDLSLLLSQNPYSSLGGLKNYGWKGVFDKYSPASEVFNSEAFSEELDTLILGDEEVGYEYLYVDTPEITLDNESYFKDASWTVAFSPVTGKWISYYDFKPNYYIAQKNYFQTGINYSTTNDNSEFGLWSHLLTNRSYQVFYGKAYKWEIEYPIQNKGGKRDLEVISYEAEALRYHNDHDYAENDYIGFDELVVFNNTNNSGKLNLITQRTLSDIKKYPITANNEQTILQTNDEGIWNINYFFNRVKRSNNNVPIWLYDKNQIDKVLNSQAISFYGKKVLERIKGQEFLANFKSSDTQHKKIMKINITKERSHF